MTTDQEKIIAMLLGELDEEEHLALQETVLDSQNYENFKVLQDQLMADFLEDRLSTERKNRFETVFLVTPARRSRLELIKALREKQAVRAKATSSWRTWIPTWFDLSQPRVRYAWGMAALVIVVALVARQLLRTPDQPGKPDIAHQQPAKVEPPPAPGPDIPEPQPPRTGDSPPRIRPKPQSPRPSTPTLPTVEKPVEPVFAVTLLPFSLRGAEEELAPVIPDNVKVVTLKLLIDPVDSFPHYNVEILTPDGNAIYRANHLKPGGKAPAQFLTLKFPINNLKDADYRIQLTGLARGTQETAGMYIFSLQRQ
ncbi:MAG: hypothetical protein HY774_07455 [Acidobacteria bacterium]|nr:hypothetical protein [Acidobacteriota bacterium]